MNSFCSAKATHIFSAKNIRILCIKSAKTVNEMTLNELVNEALNNWALDLYLVPGVFFFFFNFGKRNKIAQGQVRAGGRVRQYIDLFRLQKLTAEDLLAGALSCYKWTCWKQVFGHTLERQFA